VSTGFTNVPENLSAQFASDIGFRWAFEERDIALKNKVTGAYKFSQDFNEAFNDLSNWYIKSERTAMYFPKSNDSEFENALNSNALNNASQSLLQSGQLDQPEMDANDFPFSDLLEFASPMHAV
jgi:hypothetical protein